MKITETDRLIIRPYKGTDGEEFFPMFKDAETMRFMHVRPHKIPEQTAAFFMKELNFGAEIWTLTDRVTHEIVGNINFLGGTRVPGMGYMLHRSYWGRGLMTEAMSAMLGYAFNEKGLNRVELWINEHNRASQRVAEKLGFRLKGRIHQRYDWEDNHHIMLVYGLWASEWPYSEKPAHPTPPVFFGVQPVLIVRDVAATVHFYREKLGFDVDFVFGDPPEHAGLARSDWSSDTAYLQVTKAPGDTKIRPQGWLYFMVDAKIDELHQVYKDNGVKILNSPQNYPWGMREFSILDLNGYELKFGTRASFA